MQILSFSLNCLSFLSLCVSSISLSNLSFPNAHHKCIFQKRNLHSFDKWVWEEKFVHLYSNTLRLFIFTFFDHKITEIWYVSYRLLDQFLHFSIRFIISMTCCTWSEVSMKNSVCIDNFRPILPNFCMNKCNLRQKELLDWLRSFCKKNIDNIGFEIAEDSIKW